MRCGSRPAAGVESSPPDAHSVRRYPAVGGRFEGLFGPHISFA
ncbi:hypothetical protein [Haloprofundus salinisoli]|nr:hypothetical protein [Haloprofundus salinisoli]